MPKELAKQYAPQGTEDRIYQNWCDKGYFHTQIDRSKKPFTIVMPPPNVTGQLHMGHAMDETWQDILTRYKRMQGYAALWVPGTDHASIATEAKVVAKMREEGLTKEMVGRDGFLERAARPFAPVSDHVLLPWADALDEADARLAPRLTPPRRRWIFSPSRQMPVFMKTAMPCAPARPFKPSCAAWICRFNPCA